MEIGSVIELDDDYLYLDNSNYDNQIDSNTYFSYYFQSGRNAIEILFKHIYSENKQVMLPNYICHSVKEAITRSGWKYVEYHLDRELNINLKEISDMISNNNISFLYVNHFFHKSFTEEIIEYMHDLKKQGIVIIEDITLNLLSTERIGFGNYIVGSLRKWFAIPDGALLLSENEIEVDYCRATSQYTLYYLLAQTLKREYVRAGHRDKILKELFMQYYRIAMEDLFNDYSVYNMSHFSKAYLKNVSIDYIRNKRKKNYDFLYSRINGLSDKIKVFEREKNMVPMMFLIECDKRDCLMEYLIEKDIYCNIHWRIVDDTASEDNRWLSNRVLSIPCDQRYSEKELEYIVSVIVEWSGKNVC